MPWQHNQAEAVYTERGAGQASTNLDVDLMIGKQLLQVLLQCLWSKTICRDVLENHFSEHCWNRHYLAAHTR